MVVAVGVGRGLAVASHRAIAGRRVFGLPEEVHAHHGGTRGEQPRHRSHGLAIRVGERCAAPVAEPDHDVPLPGVGLEQRECHLLAMGRVANDATRAADAVGGGLVTPLPSDFSSVGE